jgi:hypothetical protein
MAEAESTLPTPIPTSLNVTALAKRFGVARSTIQRRLAKGWTPPARVQRRATPPATPDAAPPAAPNAPPQVAHLSHPAATVTVATIVAALALATCSAAFSISGLTSIFAGAFWPVIGLGAAFELGKLSAVAWLGQRNGPAPLRLALGAVVAVLMILNSIGVYGFLSRAHLEHSLAGDLTVSSKAADIDAHMEAKQADLDDIKARIAQLDQTKTIATKGHTKTTTVGDQGPARDKLVHEREAAENALANLRIEKAKVDGERKAVEADLGPVRYLATLLGSTDEQTMRYFILVVALLLDPAAVLLLLAATGHRD